MRFGAMGDILLTTPALAALRKKWPTTKIIYATKELYVDLIRTHAAIDEIIALKEGENILLVQTDNTLNESSVPTQKTDWWPWGGIVGDVYIVETPREFIQNAYLQLNPENFSEALFKLEMHDKTSGQRIKIEIPELQFIDEFTTIFFRQLENK